jgi:hypothetical protein
MVTVVATRRGPDNSMRTAISGQFEGAAWTNVWWTQHTVSGTPAQADVDFVSAAIAAAMNNRFKNHQMVNTAYQKATSTFFLPGGLVINSVTPLATAGTDVSGANLPANCAVGVSWISNVYWRGGKPRNYFCGISSNDMNLPADSQHLTAAAVAAWDGNAGLYLTDVNAITHGAITGTALGFVSFRSGNADRPAPLFFPFLGHRVHNRLDTQRRRLGRET